MTKLNKNDIKNSIYLFVLLKKTKRKIMKKIIVCLTIIGALFFVSPMIAVAFTVSQPNNLSKDVLYFRKSFINQNSFSEKVLITIKVQIITNNVIRNHNYFFQMNQAIAVFSSVMEENGWLARAWFPQFGGNRVDGVLTFRQDGSPSYINQINGQARTVYYNHNMGLRSYFVIVNQKIHRRLSNAGYIPIK